MKVNRAGNKRLKRADSPLIQVKQQLRYVKVQGLQFVKVRLALMIRTASHLAIQVKEFLILGNESSK